MATARRAEGSQRSAGQFAKNIFCPLWHPEKEQKRASLGRLFFFRGFRRQKIFSSRKLPMLRFCLPSALRLMLNRQAFNTSISEKEVHKVRRQGPIREAFEFLREEPIFVFLYTPRKELPFKRQRVLLFSRDTLGDKIGLAEICRGTLGPCRRTALAAAALSPLVPSRLIRCKQKAALPQTGKQLLHFIQ